MQRQSTRRSFLKTTGAFALGAGMRLATTRDPLAMADDSATAELAEPAELAALRKQARHRRRRIIFNNDGSDLSQFVPPASGAGTIEAFLAKRSKQTLGTQVDTMFYCTTATLMGTYLTDVSEIHGQFGAGSGGPYSANIAALKAAGHDCLTATVDFCHANQLEVFWSHRMNDIHDSFVETELCRWKREHPEHLLGSREERAEAPERTIRRYWSALDYEKPLVRDYLCRIQEDVCSRYDIDGVECDYTRSPMLFRTIMEGQPATPAQVDILTGFQRRLREMYLREGTKRGRPILTAVHVPATPAACRYVGIDIERWIGDGLIDVLVVGSGYLPFTEPVDEIIQLAHDAGIPAYPSISKSGMRDDYGTLEAWRGAAANMFHAGADGIYTFNQVGLEPEPSWMDLGSLATLADRNKLFVIEPDLVWKKGELYGDAITWPYPMPLVIAGDGTASHTQLPIGDDLAAAGKRGTLKSADLRIQLSDPKVASAVEVRLNGALLTSVEQAPKTGWLVFQPRAEQYRLGLNELSFSAVSPSPEAKSLGDVTRVEVPVIYK